LPKVLKDFGKDVNSWFVSSIGFILLEVVEIGGGTTGLFTSLADFTQRSRELEKEGIKGAVQLAGAMKSMQQQDWLKAKDELEPLFYGDQTARWEGDTLVIDSISIDERAQIRDGWFHSDELHVIERLRRPSKNYLEYQFTIEDPKVLTKPWTSTWNTFSLSANNEDLLENFCTNNANIEQLKKLTEVEKKQ